MSGDLVRRWRRGTVTAVIGCLVAGLTTACAARPASTGEPHVLQVVTTTAVLADMVRHVAGDAAHVHSLVPAQADPHSHEPSLRDVRTVAHADVAFSNYLMLEKHSIVRTLDNNLRPGTPNIALAEASGKYGAQTIALVENANLDTIWLGLRVRGAAPSRASEVRFRATGHDGPGAMAAYITGTFGEPRVFSRSDDGFDERGDHLDLPTDAHTHMSWAFTEPGVHRLQLAADLHTSAKEAPRPVGTGEVVFLVGEDMARHPELKGRTVLDAGHADITADLRSGQLSVVSDGHGPTRTFDPHDVVVSVPPKALTEVPATPGFRFLGRPGTMIHQLPQAVLGAHVHGEIDPHLWLDVANAKAYVRTITDVLSGVDPAHRTQYETNSRRYLDELSALDARMARTLQTIPSAHRQLVTTHDAYAYLARAHHMNVAGFVTPNPSAEPSMAQRRKLLATIRQLHVPAVFLEPALAQRSSVLRSLAQEAGVQVCTIRSDSFDDQMTSYTELMAANADELARCLA